MSKISQFVSRNRVYLLFCLSIFMSAASLAWVVLDPSTLTICVLVGVAMLNVAFVVISEQGGFYKASEMRRAFEPQRRFSRGQEFGLILLVMLQLTGAANALLG